VVRRKAIKDLTQRAIELLKRARIKMQMRECARDPIQRDNNSVMSTCIYSARSRCVRHANEPSRDEQRGSWANTHTERESGEKPRAAPKRGVCTLRCLRIIFAFHLQQ